MLNVLKFFRDYRYGMRVAVLNWKSRRGGDWSGAGLPVGVVGIIKERSMGQYVWFEMEGAAPNQYGYIERYRLPAESLQLICRNQVNPALIPQKINN